MKQGQRLTENGHDVALFPMEVMTITQVPNTIGDTHEGTLNIDLAGIDGGVSNLYAPFTMKVVQNNNTANHEIIWWSTDLVKCADGKTRLLSMRTLHDDDVSDLKVGTIKVQGEVATQEGNTGQSQGNHSHLCVANGHTTKISVKPSGYRDLVGSIDPRNVFFINDTIIKRTMGTNWEIYKEPIIPEPVIEPIPEPIEEPEIVIPVIIEPEPIVIEEPIIIPEPIADPTPIVTPEPITNTNETQTTHHEPVNVLYRIIEWLINIIKLILKGK